MARVSDDNQAPFLKASDKEAFVNHVWEEGERHRRTLPWRHIDDAYAVLVSEVMLQQTQVARVLNFWPRFLGRFPTIDALAAAETGAVLESWQGLGYNRRALALKHAAESCSAENAGELPTTVEGLLALPGIGPATAAGVMAFAYNAPGVYLETNVRSVFIHEFFGKRQTPVKDAEIIPLVEETCPVDCARDWYYALLDYGAHLKQVTPNPSRKSAHHTRQSAFEGSRRQKRAEIVRIVLEEPGLTAEAIARRLDDDERASGRMDVEYAVFCSILDDLTREGFFAEREGRFFS